MSNTELTLNQLSEVTGGKWQKPSKKTGAGPLVKVEKLTEPGFLPYISDNRDLDVDTPQSVDCYVRRLECVLK